MTDTKVRITGGCQCGAVRYALHKQPDFPHICHCRMCQKAFGSLFAPLTGVPLAAFEVTRGELAIFKSSDQTERGFCRDCGTPLSFRRADSDGISVSIGSLDDPESVAPTIQCGSESRVSWFGALAALPAQGTSEEEEPELTGKIAASNRQHPDHDTGTWPPAGST